MTLETVVGWLLTTNPRIHALSITYSVKLHQPINKQYHQQYPSAADAILETVIGWLLTTNPRIHALSITQYSVKLHQSINKQYHQQYEILLL